MMLIEQDKRGSEHAIPLTYSDTGEKFSVPENLHLVGLMNTADRSLAMVDYALRRRFRFIELRPQFDHPDFAEHLRAHNATDAMVERIIGRVTALNEKIEGDRKNLGRGFVVGHSFFCLPSQTAVADDDWYRSVVLSEVAPLIEEYWFDRQETAKKWINELLAS
jgi:5-methylcytosine-specific restriction enzyme B